MDELKVGEQEQVERPWPDEHEVMRLVTLLQKFPRFGRMPGDTRWMELGGVDQECAKAAAAVESLWAELQRTKEALAVSQQDESDMNTCWKVIAAERDQLRAALEFYAHPDTYFACAFAFDPPCGEFNTDFDYDEEYERPMPGKRARAALAQEQPEKLPR